MPNWCDNMVTFSHNDKSKIDALEAEMDKKTEEGQSVACPFNHLRPQPPEIANGDGWYDWNVSNWGTKWDAQVIDWERQSDNSLWLSMNTAWSPPTALYDYLCEEGWGVNAVYYEPGMGFGGVYEDGNDSYYEFDWTNREDIEDLPEELIEFGDLLTQFDEYEKDRISEEWGDAERTEWHDISTKPQLDGYYEITTKSWDYPQLVKYEFGEWNFWNKEDMVQWRGLAEEPNSETEVD